MVVIEQQVYGVYGSLLLLCLGSFTQVCILSSGFRVDVEQAAGLTMKQMSQENSSGVSVGSSKGSSKESDGSSADSSNVLVGSSIDFKTETLDAETNALHASNLKTAFDTLFMPKMQECKASKTALIEMPKSTQFFSLDEVSLQAFDEKKFEGKSVGESFEDCARMTHFCQLMKLVAPTIVNSYGFQSEGRKHWYIVGQLRRDSGMHTSKFYMVDASLVRMAQAGLEPIWSGTVDLSGVEASEREVEHSASYKAGELLTWSCEEKERSFMADKYQGVVKLTEERCCCIEHETGTLAISVGPGFPGQSFLIGQNEACPVIGVSKAKPKEKDTPMEMCGCTTKGWIGPYDPWASKKCGNTETYKGYPSHSHDSARMKPGSVLVCSAECSKDFRYNTVTKACAD